MPRRTYDTEIIWTLFGLALLAAAVRVALNLWEVGP